MKIFSVRDKLTKFKEDVSSAIKLSDQTIYLKRIEICKECPSLFKPISQCKECGCLIYTKAKLDSQSCPLGKW